MSALSKTFEFYISWLKSSKSHTVKSKETVFSAFRRCFGIPLLNLTFPCTHPLNRSAYWEPKSNLFLSWIDQITWKFHKLSSLFFALPISLSQPVFVSFFHILQRKTFIIFLLFDERTNERKNSFFRLRRKLIVSERMADNIVRCSYSELHHVL